MDLKALTRERGLLGYSGLKRADLIAFLQANLQPCTRPPPIPALRPPQVPAPRLPPAMRTRPPRPTGPPPPPPQVIAVQAQLFRFRADRQRQPELLRQLNSQPVRPILPPAPEFKPYQLKPKRGTNVEPFIEPPIAEPPEEQPTDPKKLNRMKKSWMS